MFIDMFISRTMNIYLSTQERQSHVALSVPPGDLVVNASLHTLKLLRTNLRHEFVEKIFAIDKAKTHLYYIILSMMLLEK